MSQPSSFARSTRLAVALTGTAVITLVVAAIPNSPAHGAVATTTLSAQSADTLPASIVTSEDAASYRDEIDAFLDTWVGRLTGDDEAAISTARDTLTSVAVRPDASRAFRQVYAEQLGRGLTPALRGKDVTIRLNAAIVVQKVARVADSSGLADLTTALIGDESAAVSLWGVKAAGPLLPSVVRAQQQGRPALVNAVVEAVKRFPQNGPLAEEAYEALTDWITGPNRPPANVVRRGVGLMVPAIHELLAFRLDLYTADGKLPAEPLAEQKALVFISYPIVWPEHADDQKVQTVQLLRDTMVQAVEAARTAQGETRDELVVLATRIGSAFVAIGDSEGQALVQAAAPVSRLPKKAAQSQLESTVNSLVDAIAAAFPNLPAPEPVTMQVPPGEPEEDETDGSGSTTNQSQ